VAAIPRFLDTNVLLRLLTRDDEERAQHALDLLLRVERGEERVVVSSLVVFELIFTLQSFYRMPRQQIAGTVAPLLLLPGIELMEKRQFVRALEVYAGSKVSFADAYAVSTMEARGLHEIYSWDSDFDGFAWITRIEPGFGDPMS
jgi:uncharacterized protein